MIRNKTFNIALVKIRRKLLPANSGEAFLTTWPSKGDSVSLRKHVDGTLDDETRFDAVKLVWD